MSKGDTLVMYTDGVTETMTIDDVEYEEHRLKQFMQTNCPAKTPVEINKALIQDLTTFANGAPQADDITILVLKVE